MPEYAVPALLRFDAADAEEARRFVEHVATPIFAENHGDPDGPAGVWMTPEITGDPRPYEAFEWSRKQGGDS